MSRAVAVVVASLVVSAGPAAAQPPARDRAASAATGTARISGRVVSADDGRPVRAVVVRISAAELGEPKSTVTDPDGRYEIAELPAGRFMVTAMKAGFVTISHGQTRPYEMGRPIDIRDGQSVEKIDFALPRGAAITGRVVDEYGEPVAYARVRPMQLRYMNGERRPMMSGSMTMQTPDTGEFRLWGLAPGDYLIEADITRGPGTADTPSGYLATYYPSAVSVAEAQPVRVEVGETRSGIDIVLAQTRTSRITGTTIDSRGQPLRGGFISVIRRSETSMSMSAGGPVRPDGTFTVTGVTPGTYLLRANNTIADPGAQPEILVANVTVAGDDLSGVVLMPVQPVTIAGRIVFDPPTWTLPPSSIRVMASPKDMRSTIPMPMPMAGPPIVRDDFTFEAKASPGEIVIRAMTTGPGSTPQWMVKSVTVDGREIIDSGIDLSSGEAIDNVEVVVTNRLQTVSGVVTDARGELAANATVFAFSQDREKWFGTARFAAVGRPDQNGRYTLRTLPPGEYFAVAVEYLDPNRRGGDPGYLAGLADQAVTFTLNEGETRTLDLRLANVR
jgi:hypothetical protein